MSRYWKISNPDLAEIIFPIIEMGREFALFHIDSFLGRDACDHGL